MSHIGTPLDLTIRTHYELLSGAAGVPRDWDRLAELYVPHARIMVLHRLSDGEQALEVMDFHQYRASREPYFRQHAFFETETERETSIRGNLAHVYSEFEARREPGGPVIMAGSNSMQLVLTHGAWRIVSSLWEAQPETPRMSPPGVIPLVRSLAPAGR